MFGKSNIPLLHGLLIGLLFVPVCLGQSSQQSDKSKAKQLVVQLADPNPAVRKQAQLSILSMGDSALPAVKNGIRNGSLEVQKTCRLLFEKLDADRKKRQIEAFLDQNPGGSALAAFRLWPGFSAFAGDDDFLTRELFLSMCDRLPLIFEEYALKEDLSASGLKQSARLSLIPERNPEASSDLLVIAYLFLSDQAVRAAADKNENLFSSVEILEAVNFMSNSEHAAETRQSKFREIIDRQVSQWINAPQNKTRIPVDSKTRLIYHSRNPWLIDEMAEGYGALQLPEKLKYIDIVSQASSQKPVVELDKLLHWLEKPMTDQSVVANSRFRKTPGVTIEVTVDRLAEAVLAQFFNKKSESPEQIELVSVFGIFPFSGTEFLIIGNQKGREQLLEAIKVRKSNQKPVE